MFIVINTGNYVMETKNIGVFEEIIKGNRVDDKENIKQIIELCNKKNIMIKEHNADYLSDEALKTHPEMGIHAINVAPEFGVTETKAILTWLSKNNLEEQKKLFLDIAFKSNKWEKWMIPNSNATQNDKSVISGHYVFSNNQFKTIIHDIKNQKKFNIYLNKEIEKVILRYMINLKLI